MLAPDWTWWTAVPIVLAAVAMLWVPGTVFAAGLGSGRWPAVALAPLMTTSLVAVGGVLTALVGVRWGIGAVLFWLAAVPALVWLVRWSIARTGREPWRFEAPPVRWWEVAIGLATAVLIAVWVFHSATVRPGNIPQQSDQIFHLGLVRYMLDSGNISSLTADGINNPDTAPFYPAALHGLAATLVLLTGAPIVIVQSSLLLVSCALVFPIGMMLMLNTLVATDRRLVLLTGVLSSIFPYFPWRIMAWGALWSQMFGSVFIPTVIAVYGWGLLQAFRRRNWGSAALLFLVALPGITLGHTSATFAAAAGAILFSIAVSLRHAIGAKRGVIGWVPLGGFVLVGVVGPIAGALVAPSGLNRTSSVAMPTSKIVIGLLTFWSDRGDPQQWAGFAITVLAVVGCIVLLRRGHDWWLPATAIVFMAVASVVTARGTQLVWPLTWPWYNWAFRVFGVTAIFALAVMIVGLSWVLTLSRRMGWVGIAWIMLVSLALVPLMVVQLRTVVALVGKEYKTTGKAAWITDEKADALRTLSQRMPADAVVAANPWRGAEFLYVIGPQRSVIPSEKSYSHDIDLLAAALKNVTTNPEVCRAVTRQHVTHVITGGTIVSGNDKYYFKYAAVDEVNEQGGFRVVARADPYTLWKVPECRG